jgi:hypothetical protein
LRQRPNFTAGSGVVRIRAAGALENLANLRFPDG